MKKILAIVLAIATVFCFAACGKKADDKVIKVGASSTPHAEILEQVKESLKKDGYELEIVVYDDYVLPNQALAEGTLDANYFQHTPYLNSYNASKGTDLVSAALIHYEPFGLYGNGVDAVADIAPGATILIPADDSNETRALLLLAQEGLIELPADASAERALPLWISSTPRALTCRLSRPTPFPPSWPTATPAPWPLSTATTPSRPV